MTYCSESLRNLLSFFVALLLISSQLHKIISTLILEILDHHTKGIGI
jgi:competence protein ComGF